MVQRRRSVSGRMPIFSSEYKNRWGRGAPSVVPVIRSAQAPAARWPRSCHSQAKATPLPHLKSRQLIRLCPQWYADIGPISLYYASRTLLPAKTRAFIELVSDAFRRDRLAERFAGSLG